jgi:alkanesulfonate monooxygenase SsuD/methylene tetrahydromethanopterin reductase-like flavin-dependent oxidoreductase (luciferase family)
MVQTPLSILDLSPVPAGGTAADAVRNSVDLAREAEAAGFHRYWLAEHHLAAGVASSATAILISQVAAATERIRVGSGAVQMGHHTALSVVEDYGTLAAFFPGRIDLGLGRSGNRKIPPAGAPLPKQPPPQPAKVVDGLLIPPMFPIAGMLRSPRLAQQFELLMLPGAQPVDYTETVHDILAFLDGSFHAKDGLDAHATPGEGADVQPWILGSSGGESALLAGKLGLPFAANYHVAPSNVLEAVQAYRSAFRPSERFREPYVLVSADIVVADSDEKAAELATPYGQWVLSIRTGQGAISYPTPAEAAAYPWTDEERALVADRVATQFVGSAATVAEKLRILQRATGADELLITTITHDHADRVRSHQLIAKEWLG